MRERSPQTMAGYSARSLVDKLGIKAGHKLCILNAPSGYDKTLGPLPPGATRLSKLSANLDFIHFFTKSKSDLEKALPGMRASLVANGMIWVSWPKGASKVATDLNENIVRELALKNKLVDVKVAAVDDVWSGLKLVIRVKDR